MEKRSLDENINDSFIIHGICMCEGVGEDSGHGAWSVSSHSLHVEFQVEMCMFLLECEYECVEHGIACALKWGVALVGVILYWA